MKKFYKEEKIATYTEKKTRVQLLKVTKDAGVQFRTVCERNNTLKNYESYQIRVNRKRVYTTGFEYDARKKFAAIVQINILQLKIYENDI